MAALLFSSLAALSLLAWIVALADRKRAFPRTRSLPLTAEAPPESEPVVAIVPSRNEALGLPATLPALLAQGADLDRILIVDDRSEDDTGTVAGLLGEDAGKNAPPVEVIRVEELPDGWMGKVHAQSAGVDRLGDDVEWILFTDADIHHGPTVVRRLLARAANGPYDLVSIMARLRTETEWERLLMPAFVYFFQAMYPFRHASEPTSDVASAAGGCVLIRRSMLDAAGGPAAYKSAVIDDLALARAVKDAGGRLWIGFDADVVSLRAYPKLGDIVDMIARSAFDELGYRYAKIPGVWLGLALLFLVPPTATIVGIVTHTPLLGALGAAGWLLATMATAPAFRLHGVSRGYALLMPIAALVYAWATTLSALRHAFGRTRRWR